MFKLISFWNFIVNISCPLAVTSSYLTNLRGFLYFTLTFSLSLWPFPAARKETSAEYIVVQAYVCATSLCFYHWILLILSLVIKLCSTLQIKIHENFKSKWRVYKDEGIFTTFSDFNMQLPPHEPSVVKRAVNHFLQVSSWYSSDPRNKELCLDTKSFCMTIFSVCFKNPLHCQLVLCPVLFISYLASGQQMIITKSIPICFWVTWLSS